MIDSNNSAIDVHELMEKVRNEVERCNQRQDNPPIRKSHKLYRKQLDRLERIETIVDDARFQSQASLQWPAKLSRFPFSLSHKLQDFVLRCFRFLFKKQTVINSDFVIALKELLRLLKDEQQEKCNLSNELEHVYNHREIASLQFKALEERLCQLEGYLSEQQKISNEQKQALLEREKAVREGEESVEGSLTAFNSRIGDVERHLLAIGERLNLSLNTEQESHSRVDSVEVKLSQVEQHLLAIGQRLHLSLEAERLILERVESAETKLAQTKEGISVQEDKIHHVLDSSDSLPEFLDAGSPGFLDQALALSGSISRSSLVQDDSEQFYHVFENFFYNTNTVKAKQKYYVDFIDPDLNAEHIFLDAGCGRGEFLENLKSSDLRAQGVDLNNLEIQELKQRGFLAVQSDILEYLNSQTELYSGISGLQVIEHLDFSYLKDLIKAAHKKIAPGGVIILETVNPHSFYGLSNFYQDPTHITPLPPELIAFLLEWYGFNSVKIVYSSLVPEHLRISKIPRMNYQDYAVIAYR